MKLDPASPPVAPPRSTPQATSVAAAGSPMAAQAEPSQPSHPSTRKRSRAAILLGLAAVVLALAVAAVLANGFGFDRGLPADLQIVGQYPFHSAEVYIWVDDDLRYHDQLRGTVNPHARLHDTAAINGGAIALTLPVRAGTHTVRVRVDAPDDSYDRDTSIPGNFTAYSQKTLLLNFKSKT